MEITVVKKRKQEGEKGTEKTKCALWDKAHFSVKSKNALET